MSQSSSIIENHDIARAQPTMSNNLKLRSHKNLNELKEDDADMRNKA
jgi:hypothetical protein